MVAKRFQIYFLLFLSLLMSLSAIAQRKTAAVAGRVIDENEQPLSGVSVVILGNQKGLVTNDTGYFRIQVTAGKALALEFTHMGYPRVQRNFWLAEGEEEFIVVRMEKETTVLDEVVVKSAQERTQAGLSRINPKQIIQMPAPIGGVESMIKVLVGSNNELSSQYNVRGGSYDENLVYVNDFEIFRPYLIRNGQQEGLSFINPEMTRNVDFYNGSFPVSYGDKMSSVLDIQYRQPKKFGGSAYVGMLEQGLHVEGLTANKRFSYLVGARNRSNRNLLRRQETSGNYVPSSSDLQGLFTYTLTPKWEVALLTNLSSTRFYLQPAYRQLTSSVITPYSSTSLGLDINFEGQERDEYATKMAGLSFSNKVNEQLQLKWLVSAFQNKEQENIDLLGTYLFGNREVDNSQQGYGTIVNPLGSGVFHNYARNGLTIQNINVAHKGKYRHGRHAIAWGLGWDRTNISDRLNEWERIDSAGYSIPVNTDALTLHKVIQGNTSLSINKFSGFVQDNILLGDSSVTLSAGLRFNYNELNKQLLISPRLAASWSPDWQQNIIFRLAAGAYHQPPFYRELRRYDGTINEQLKAQKSWQLAGGLDYSFDGWGKPMRWTAEAYYKHMTDVVPYDIDNVRIRYFGENNAKAYAAGLEMRLFGELVKGAESWISVGLMNTKENIKGDTYMDYLLGPNGLPVDSMLVEKGWVRRPTDRRFTFGMFLQDYLSTNKNFKVHLNLLYGSNLPYNVPNSVKNRNALMIPAYIRADIGFSALLLDTEKSRRRRYSPFMGFDNIWASLEIFNLIDRDNTISYLLVKDYSNTIYAMPQRLTPRLVNFKIVARW